MNLNTTLLTFIAGFILAVLIFIPLLLLAGRSSRRNSAPSTGKHALDKPAKADKPGKTGKAEPRPPATQRPKPEKTIMATPRPASASHGETGTRSAAIDQDSTPTEPRLPIEIIKLPLLPSNLFERHFASKFARLNRRTDRLRAELSEL